MMDRRFFRGWLVIASFFVLGSPGMAQYDHFDQAALAELVSNQVGSIDSVTADMEFWYYIAPDSSVLWNLHLIKRRTRGEQNKELVQLLNRNQSIYYLHLGDTLILPDRYDGDLRAYSPYPREYLGAQELDKLMIIDKTLQAFAAYEYGKLARWGPVNTGGAGTETPGGRYNYNWKQEYRVSSLSPRDDPWEMYWVFNFHEPRGIHTHQYFMPTGTASSHGCVRLMNADAKWIYDWADGYVKRRNRIVEQGTMVLVIGEADHSTLPSFFDYTPDGPVLKRRELPEDPWAVPPGTTQQEQFDRLREQERAQRIKAAIEALDAEVNQN